MADHRSTLPTAPRGRAGKPGFPQAPGGFDMERLLFRDTAAFDPGEIAYYRGKTALVTGAGGSIGGELCRQLCAAGVARLVLLDIYENGVYDLIQALGQQGAEAMLTVRIASVRDARRVAAILEETRPQVIFHAAAHKHVPLMEENVAEAVSNNVFGTLTLADAAARVGVERFILISTDKAVNPTSVMGATKRLCELIVRSRQGGCVFAAVRFGNVLGSSGSVIPLFRAQIEAGGPVRITDKRVVRYFMTIAEAASLVMRAGAMAQTAEVYVLDMGRPVRVLDLAQSMIRLYGLEPYKDIAIEEIGLRSGEKLYEELLVDTKTMEKTANRLIFVERETPVSPACIDEKLAVLHAALDTGRDDAVRQALHRVLPSFHTPEEVNRNAEAAEEMRAARQGGPDA